jgi:DNA-binding Lrp family transcriptional regulator
MDIDLKAIQRLQANGLSQRAVARQLGIPRSTLQDHLKRTQAVDIHRGKTLVLPQRRPRLHEVYPLPETPAGLEGVAADLLERAQWWRTRKLRQVDPSRSRDTRRQTWHVEVQWIARVKDMADAEGMPQSAVVDQIFRAYFQGRSDAP